MTKAMAGELVFTVSKLNEYASRVLSNDPRLRSIRVSGEISGFKRHSSGHLYFNLKDEGAVISCVMFRSNAASLSIQPKDGLKVVARGSVNIYPRDGKYQLYVEGMRTEGTGELYQQFLLLKDRLESEGLFANNRPIPFLPKSIGVVTSPTGAALQDILNIIRRRFPKMNVVLAPCQVQGENAPSEIVSAINALQASGLCDVMIVGRGGGSYEDLYCFNDERIARAVFSSRIPVVSAVGHETDFTIIDFAADLRAPTPSAAAELCCPKYSEMEFTLRSLRDSVEGVMIGGLKDARAELERLEHSSALRDPHYTLGIYRERLRMKLQLLDSRSRSVLMNTESKLYGTLERLKTLDPENVIKRGYSIVTDSEGNIVKSAAELKPDAEIGVRMKDGSLSARIIDIERGKKHGN